MNAVISTNERAWTLTGHVTFKLHYNQIYPNENPLVLISNITLNKIEGTPILMVKQSKVPGYKMIFTKIRDHRFLKLISISLFKFYTCIIQPKKAKFYIGSLREGKAPLVVQVSPF